MVKSNIRYVTPGAGIEDKEPYLKINTADISPLYKYNIMMIAVGLTMTSQKTRDLETMLGKQWSSVCDSGPTLTPHLVFGVIFPSQDKCCPMLRMSSSTSNQSRMEHMNN